VKDTPTMQRRRHVGAGSEQAVDLEVGGVGGGVAGVTLVEGDIGTEHAAGGVDVLDGHVGAGELGRAEEGEVAGDRQDRADGEDAVGLAARTPGLNSRRRRCPARWSLRSCRRWCPGIGRFRSGLRASVVSEPVSLLDESSSLPQAAATSVRPTSSAPTRFARDFCMLWFLPLVWVRAGLPVL
jgi:hypothetical protein